MLWGEGEGSQGLAHELLRSDRTRVMTGQLPGLARDPTGWQRKRVGGT